MFLKTKKPLSLEAFSICLIQHKFPNHKTNSKTQKGIQRNNKKYETCFVFLSPKTHITTQKMQICTMLARIQIKVKSI